jgi:hypothetical protein
MAKSKAGKKPAAESTTKPLTIDPKALKELKADHESLSDEDRALLMGMMVINPKGALEALQKRQEEKTKAQQFEAWVGRQSARLSRWKQHKPVAALYVGKAMAVRARFDPTLKDGMSRPVIFGVFASREASGVLQVEKDFNAAVGCANKTTDKELSDRASRALDKPLGLLYSHALIERTPPSGKVRFAAGCELVFDDARIKWPPPKRRSSYVELR